MRDDTAMSIAWYIVNLFSFFQPNLTYSCLLLDSSIAYHRPTVIAARTVFWTAETLKSALLPNALNPLNGLSSLERKS